MSVTINGLTINSLTAQPFAYDSTDVSKGLVARSWIVSGLLTTTQLAQFKSIFDTWRAARINDADSVASNSVGTTVALSASANGLTASGVACWFAEAPAFEQLGAYVQVSCRLVAAADALAVAKKEAEDGGGDLGNPDLGTFSLGGVTITLTEPMHTVGTLPTLDRTSAGFAYITGPLLTPEVRQITGTVANESAYLALVDWVRTTAASTPAANSWYPTSAPTASAEHKIVSGVKVVEWTVTLTVEKV